MTTIDQSGLRGKIRDKVISQELERVLERAGIVAGIDTIVVTSGGQPGSTGKRTGSHRHDNGRAADLQLVKDGHTLTFTDEDGGPVVEAFVTAAAANGATGIGAGIHYMGNKTLHVGFGNSPQDHSKLVWGAGGRSVNAPHWLRVAAQKGWSHPAAEAVSSTSPAPTAGHFIVVSRDGLHMRSGPGLDFNILSTIPNGTLVTVDGFDGPNNQWARVDLQGDGLLDGHMFAAFLRSAEAHNLNEGEEELAEQEA